MEEIAGGLQGACIRCFVSSTVHSVVAGSSKWHFDCSTVAVTVAPKVSTGSEAIAVREGSLGHLTRRLVDFLNVEPVSAHWVRVLPGRSVVSVVERSFVAEDSVSPAAAPVVAGRARLVALAAHSVAVGAARAQHAAVVGWAAGLVREHAAVHQHAAAAVGERSNWHSHRKSAGSP